MLKILQKAKQKGLPFQWISTLSIFLTQHILKGNINFFFSCFCTFIYKIYKSSKSRKRMQERKKRQQIYESWKFCNFCYNQDHKHFLFPAKFSSMNSKEWKETKLFFLPISIHTYIRHSRNPPCTRRRRKKHSYTIV